MSIALGELAVRFGCELIGDPQLQVHGVAPIGSAGAGELGFLANPRLASQLALTRATAIVLDARSAPRCPVAALVSPNPHATFALIAAQLYPSPPAAPGIHPSAVVDPTAQIDPSAEIGPLAHIGPRARIGPRAIIGPGCSIDADVQIAADCRLLARVTVLHGVQIGARALIHPGAVLGADGFGHAREGARWIKVPQLGGVRIEADVEIGANTTIDRGALDDTVIGEGVKLDNQIQVAHNVRIGAHTAIAACTGISGSTRIGARCMIGGGCGIAGHIDICDDTVLTGMTSISNSIRQPGIYSGGIPGEPARRWRRIVGRLKLLAERPVRGDRAASPSEAPQEPDHD